jgi:hypothetical protein
VTTTSLSTSTPDLMAVQSESDSETTAQLNTVPAGEEATAPESDTVDSTATAESTEAVVAEFEEEPATVTADDPESLAALPPLSGGGLGAGGMGGGADVAGETITETASMPPLVWNPLADAEYTLNTELPADTIAATVYSQPGTGWFDLEDMARYAEAFGVDSPVYQERFIVPAAEPDVPAWTPPQNYFMFDGDKTMSLFDNYVYYNNQAVNPDYQIGMLDWEQAVPIAEAFLQEAGLLNFPYEIVPSSAVMSDVAFRRLVDGNPVSVPEYSVAVTENGEIFSISVNALDGLQGQGNYPLIPASAAWQNVVENGVDFRRTFFNTYPGEGFDFGDQPTIDIPFKSWQRGYEDGQTVQLYAWPSVFLPVDSDDPPRIVLDGFVLVGDVAQLNDIADNVTAEIQLEGIYRESEGLLKTIEVISWEPLSTNVNPVFLPGTIQVQEGQTLLAADIGGVYVLPNPPDDLVDGERVNVFGWPGNDVQDGIPVLNWRNLDRIINYEDYALPEDQVVDEGPYRITEVVINSVRLVYAYTPLYEDDSAQMTIIIQPAWQFTGTTNNNEVIEITAQAIPDDYFVDPERR